MNIKLRFILVFISTIVSTVAVFTQHIIHVASCDTSSVTYRLVHPLHVIEATSKDASFTIDLDTLSNEINAVSAKVDVMTFNSGNSNRDSHAMEVIDALTYPEASFSSSNIIQHVDSLNVIGKLTFHGVAREINIYAVIHGEDKRFFVDGTFDISLTDFRIDRPSMLMIPVSDDLHFSFKAVFAIQGGHSFSQ